jgi:predicted anti-sigma-YlaC factor YlaD
LLISVLALLAASASCTRIVVNRVGSALNSQGSVFAAEDDPELVREAIPFGVKTLEALLEASPQNENLLLAAASGFTQYAYAFVLQDAQMLEDSQPAKAKEKLERAKRLFQRAWRYGFRGMEARHKGFGKGFATDRTAALSSLGNGDVPLLYWTAAALVAQISISKDDMKLVGRLPEVEALMGKALELDEGWNDGAIHEFYVAYEDGRSAGSLARARLHYERVLALTQQQKLPPLVSWAEGVAVQQQDRKCFHDLLDQVIAFDADSAPRFRLVNLIAQRRARWLKSRAADLFLEE